MQSTPRERLLQFSHVLQTVLFDRMELAVGPLSENARLLVAVLSMLPLTRWIAPQRGWRGRPSKDRQALAAAFLAKAIYGLETTRQMRERLRSGNCAVYAAGIACRASRMNPPFRAPSPNFPRANCHSGCMWR